LKACSVEPGVLAGKTLLQHLQLTHSKVPGGATGVAQLLSHLQPMPQLTHLDLQYVTWEAEDRSPPAAAYAVLTASSKLQHLNLAFCTLPAGVWQHMFPTGRQLPQLQYLKVGHIKQPGGSHAPAPEGSRLVSCCPGLQSLYMEDLQYSAERLAPLSGLSVLHTLRLATDDPTAADGMETVCQLTGLRELHLHAPCMVEGLPLQLTQLQQLTQLHYKGDGGDRTNFFIQSEPEVCVTRVGPPNVSSLDA
jgi:hypothetical protein